MHVTRKKYFPWVSIIFITGSSSEDLAAVQFSIVRIRGQINLNQWEKNQTTTHSILSIKDISIHKTSNNRRLSFLFMHKKTPRKKTQT